MNDVHEYDMMSSPIACRSDKVPIVSNAMSVCRPVQDDIFLHPCIPLRASQQVVRDKDAPDKAASRWRHHRLWMTRTIFSQLE